MAEERDFRRKKLLGKYMTKILYRWDCYDLGLKG